MRSGNIHLVVAAALLFLFEAAALVCCYPNTTTFHCVESERQALLKFKACFSNDPWNIMLSSWKGNGCCMWKGVRCDKIRHHIVSLELGGGERYNLQLVNCSGDDVAPSLLELKFLEHLDLSGNDFNNSDIPPSFGLMNQLRYLNLSNAHFSGRIPPQLGNLTRLRVLDLHYYSWVDDDDLEAHDIRWISQLGSLQHLDMGGVNLSSATSPNVFQILRLFNNSLHGELPSTLANCTKLEGLDLGENDLCGNITWIGESLGNLWVLRLRKNKFSGNFPSELCYLSSLRILDLADNRLSGELPSCFDNLSCMVNSTICLYTGYTTPVKEFMKGVLMEYERKTARMLYTLDLSSNTFVGSIPRELASLKRLIGLNLSHNHLSGAIPENIGPMNNLESLDLSRNGLSGTIPSSLSSINTLSRLNLSYNNLSGPIPTGYQLQTLEDPASIYMGNPLLCGPPLLTKCQSNAPPPTSKPSQSEDIHEDRHEKMWLYLIVASGFATGFWGVIGVLIFMKSWRYALFRMVDDVQDRIYVAFALKVKRVKKMLNGNRDDQ